MWPTTTRAPPSITSAHVIAIDDDAGAASDHSSCEINARASRLSSIAARGSTAGEGRERLRRAFGVAWAQTAKRPASVRSTRLAETSPKSKALTCSATTGQPTVSRNASNAAAHAFGASSIG